MPYQLYSVRSGDFVPRVLHAEVELLIDLTTVVLQESDDVAECQHTMPKVYISCSINSRISRLRYGCVQLDEVGVLFSSEYFFLNLIDLLVRQVSAACSILHVIPHLQSCCALLPPHLTRY